MSKWGRMLTALILTAALCLGAVSAAAQGVLTLPSAVKEIQAEAFAGAQGVDKIVLPDGVLVIGSRAFAGSSVAQINLPAGLTDIAQDAFADCDVLAAVEEGSYAHAWCEANGVRYMFDIDATPEEYFDYVVVNGKARVTDYTGSDVNVVIPPMMGGYPVTAMERTFDNNDEIVTVVLPSTLKTLGGYTFWGCDNLRSVTFNSDITAVGEFEFFQCRVLEDFMLPESVTKIGTRAFAGCHGLTKLPFGGHVKTIGESAFEEGWGFTEIEIPDGVQTIGARAFADGQDLKKVIVPESVTSIGANAFASCHRDFALYGVSGSYAQTYAEANGLRFVALDEIVPVEFTYVVNEMGTFVNGYTGTATQIVIPASIDGVKMDGVWNWAFKDNTEITGVTLSEGLTMIGGEAFRGCTALERVTLPESLTTISAAAFRECTALEEIVLPDNATLGWGVFYDCANLNSVTLPANLTAIPAYAFRGCSLLISAPIPAGVTEIGEYAFCACYNLRGVQIPAGVTAIGEHAFDECEMIDEIILPETLQTLGGYAFYSAGSLQRVEFNSDITEIGEFTFFQCVNLKDIQLPSSVTSIGTSAFVGCNGLTTLPFGEGVVTIGERAFAECYYLTEIEIPETVTSIGARAFSFCYDLKKATIPATVTEIGEMAFWNNDESFTIYGYTGSAAQTFALNNDILFVALDGGDEPAIGETPATSFEYTSNGSEVTIQRFIGSETDVVIPAAIDGLPVTRVNSGAFYTNSTVTSVVFPESIWEIGEYCFSMCEALERVEITAATETIGANIFNECPDVTVYGAENSYAHLYTQRWGVPFVATSHLPARTSDYYLTTDGDEATILFYTGSMTDLVIPSVIDGYTITGIGNYAFSDVDGLTKVTLPSTLKVIGKHAFSYTGLKEIEIPDGVFKIGTNAFRECYGLTKATIPASVTGIDSGAFRDCGDNFTIYGYTGSRAESFASEQNYLFVALDGGEEPEETDFEFGYNDDLTELWVTAYNGTDEIVTVPAEYDGLPVTKVTYNAFRDNTTVKRIILPDSIREIDHHAFAFCENLEEINLPEGMTKVGYFVFNGCESLKNVTLPSTLTVLDDGAFQSCASLTEMTVPEGVTELSDSAFMSCTALEKITLPSTITRIGVSAFSNDAALAQINLPQGLTDIDDYAFYGCESLAQMQIPDGVTHIGEFAFANCDGLEHVTLPEGLTELERYTFSGCDALTALDIPDSVTVIGEYAVANCDGLTSLTLPANLETIGNYAFYGCGNYYLQAIELPASVKTIGDYAFQFCSGLTSATIYSTDAVFGSSAFANCQNLTICGYAGSTAEAYASASGIPFTALSGEPQTSDFQYYVSEDMFGTTYVGITRYSGNAQAVVIPAQIDGYPVKVIDEGAFYGNQNVTSVVIPEGVTDIEDECFSGCVNLTSVTLPSTLEFMGAYCFDQCAGLTNVSVPAATTSIGAGAFNGCTNVTIYAPGDAYAHLYALRWDIPFVATDSSAAASGEYIYSVTDNTCKVIFYTGNAQELTVPDTIDGYTVTVIGENAFAGLSSLKRVTLPATVEVIERAAFSYSGVEEVTVQTTWGAIYPQAFKGCASLSKIVIPEGVYIIFEDAFEDCGDGLTIYGVAGSQAQTYANYMGIPFVELGSEPETPAYTYTLSGFEVIITGYTGEETELAIPSELEGYPVTTIGNYAFENWTHLTKVTLPSTLERIGVGAFAGCTGLTEMTIPAGVTEIADSAFWGCTGLTEIMIPDGVTSIGGFAFASCSGMTKATIPVSVTSIGERAFYECAASFAIHGYTGSYAQTYASANSHPFIALDAEPEDPQGEQTEGDYTYTVENGKATVVAYTGSDADVVIPAALGGYPVERIGEYAFEAKTLTTVIIPEGVTEIGMGAFYWCESLRAAAIPASIANIGDRAFSSCHADLIITGTAGTIAQNHAWENAIGFADAATGEILFNNDFAYTVENGVATLTLYTGDDSELVVPAQYDGYTVGALRWGVLQQCDTLTKVTVEARVPDIPRAAFQNCDLLVEVVLPDSVTSIAANAFRWCYKLETVHIPASVTSIDATAFDECDADLTFYGEAGSYAQTYAAEHGIAFVAVGGGEEPEAPKTEDGYVYEVMCFDEAGVIEEAVIVGYVGSESDLVIPAQLGGYPVTTVAPEAFASRLDITSVVFPEGLTLIATNAFAYCTNLTSASFPSTLIEFYGSAFAETGLTEVTLPENMDYIAFYAFEGCKDLTKVTVLSRDVAFERLVFSNGSENLVIHGYTGSTAEAHAAAQGIPFVALDAPVTPEPEVTPKPTPDPSQPYEENGYTYYYLPEEQAVSISSYSGNDQDLVIPSTLGGYPVVQIGMHAFSFKDTLRTVTIPYGVKRILTSAIKSCPNLTSVSMPESVTELGDRVFAQCPALTSVNLPSGLTAIGEALFEGCSALESVEIPAGVVSIGDYAFYACTSLKRADIPAGVVSIGSNAFANCGVLQNVTIPQGVTRIEEYAFYACDGLTQIDIHDNITYIGSTAFYGCDGLTSVTIPEQVTELGDYAFYGCTKLDSVTIENPALVFGANAFDYFYKLTIYGYTGSTAQNYAQANGAAFVAMDGGSEEPDVPVVPPAEEPEFDYFCDGYTVTIDGYNGSDTNVVIPATIEGCPVTEISYNAFQFNTAITSVVIPDSVEILGDSCFEGCSALASVSLGSGLKQIGMNAFSGCTALARLTLPEGLEMIGEAAFISSGLTEITVPKSVYQLGANAFRYNYAMTEATIKGDLGYLSDFAFIGNTALRKVTITGGVSAIGEMAFGSCSALEEITIPASVTQIADNAFDEEAELTIYGYAGSYAQTYAAAKGYAFVVLEEGPVMPEEPIEPEEPGEATPSEPGESTPGEATPSEPEQETTPGEATPSEPEQETTPGEATPDEPEIEETPATSFTYTIANEAVTIDSFTGSETEVIVPESIEGFPVTMIGENAFKGCTAIAKVILPAQLKEIGASAFSGCFGLAEVYFPNGLEVIMQGAFKECILLEEANLPDSVHTIGEECFLNCVSLTYFHYPLSLNGLASRHNTDALYGGNVFTGCEKLTSITVPEGITTIPVNMFGHADYLEEISLPSTLKTIDTAAFVGCVKIVNIEFPDGLEVVKQSAFKDCTLLAAANLPDSVHTIGEECFLNCVSLTYFHYPLSLTGLASRYNNSALYGGNVFTGCEKLTSITVPEGITEIPSNMFGYSDYLETVNLPSTLKIIQDAAFRNCTSMVNIVFPEGLEIVKQSAFRNCTLLAAANLPDSVHTIGEECFLNCESMVTFRYPLSWTYLASRYGNQWVYDGNIFTGCKALTSITVPEGIVTIPEKAFSYSDYLVEVSLPSTLKSIGARAFRGCDRFTDIYIAPSVKSIGEDAFKNCPNLTIECEWNSVALDYAKANDNMYYYLSLTEASMPEDTLYKGDHYALNGYVRSNIGVSRVTATIYNADRTQALQTVTVEPGETDYDLSGYVNNQLRFEELELGTYGFVLQASTERSEEVYANTTFTLVPPPLRGRIRNGKLPVGFYDPKIPISGTLESNYPMDELHMEITRLNGTVVREATYDPEGMLFDLSVAAETFDLNMLAVYEYILTITIKGNGETLTVYQTQFMPAYYDGIADDAMFEAVLNYVAKPDNLLVFRDYMYKITDEINNLGTKEKVLLTITGYDDVLSSEFVDFCMQYEHDTYLVKVYKTEIMKLLEQIAGEGKIESVDSGISTGILKSLQQYGKINLEYIKRDVIPTLPESRKADCLPLCESIDAQIEAIGFGEEVIKQSTELLNFILFLAQNYEKEMAIIDAVQELTAGRNDPNYQQAVAEIRMAFRAKWLSFLVDNWNAALKEVGKESIDIVVKFLVKKFNVNATYAVVKFVEDIFMKLSGADAAADDVKTLMARFSSVANANYAYQTAFNAINEGDTSSDIVQKFVVAFQYARQAYYRAYQVLEKRTSDSDEILELIEMSYDISVLTIPGIDMPFNYDE